MSGDNDGGAVGIEMVDLEIRQDPADADHHLKGEKRAERPFYKARHTRSGLNHPYKDTFKNTLTDHNDDEMTWWDAVDDLLKKFGEFAEKVAAKSRAEGEKQREQVIVEVMVDLLLDMEGMVVHEGLVYVLEEGLDSYPLELMAVELLKRGADPNEEKGYSGSTPLHLAITEKKVNLVKMLLEKGAHVETKDDDGCTPLLTAVRDGVPEGIIDLLLDHGADVQAVTDDRKTALHFAAQRGEVSLMESIIKRGLSVDAEDKDGWRPLHEAAFYGSKDAVVLLVENGALVNAKDHRKRTPLHVAADEGEDELISLLLEQKADANVADLDGNTPLDLAAKKQHKEAVELIQTHSFCPKKDAAVKMILEKAMNRDHSGMVKDDFVKQKIGELSPFSVVSMFKSTKCGGEGKYQFLKQFVKEPMLKKSTMAIMDHFVLGKRHGRVDCEIIEADMNGNPPDVDGFDESSQSLLDVIVEQNDKELAQHPSIKAILEYKWKTFARWLFFVSLAVYATRMLFFGLALFIAARPELDNPGCYRDGWDYFRGVCEGISIIFFLSKIVDEIVEMCSLQKVYFRDYYNYLQWVAVILPLLIIPLRAATTWCASTGDGYCIDPTLLPPAANATNFTLDINQDCITASQIQWIVASLAYMANAFLVVEFLALSRTLGVYVKIVIGIVMKDILKFTAIFIVGLYVFVGSFYLALRAGVTVQASTGAIISDLEKFELQTLYPWHVVFTGFRILIHGGGIFRLGYFANDDDGQYVGYQWFSIVLYLTFLFIVTVVLLSLLIAQMNDTYRNIQEDVEGTFAIARARIIARIQNGNMWLLCRKKTYRKHYFKKQIWSSLTDEELKQEEEEENAEEKVALMEQKTDWLKDSSGDMMRRLKDRENSAQKIKRLMEQKMDCLSEVTAEGLQKREASAQHIKSLMEHKVDHLTGMTAEVKIGLRNREDSAQEIKSGMEQKFDHLTEMTAEVTRGLLNREDSAQQIKSGMEEKVDHLTKMTAEVTRGLLNREDSAQQIKSHLEQKVDRLAEMMAELMKRLPKNEEEGGPPLEGD